MYVYPRILKKFKKYGLFSKFKPSNYVDNCLVTSLIHCGIPESMIDMVKLYTKGKLYTATNLLSKIAKLINKYIVLHVYYLNDSKINKIETFGKKNNDKIELALIMQQVEGKPFNHYMVYDKKDIKQILKIIREYPSVPITSEQFAKINTDQ